MRVAVTADHNGRVVKDAVCDWLRQAGHQVDDRSPAADDTVDYPPLCADVAYRVVDGAADFAVVVGGSGQGEQIACNKVAGIRAALCNLHFPTEIARAHNDANVMVLGAKVVTATLAVELVERWLRTPFKGGVHQRRLEQIAALERGERLVRPDLP